VDGGSALKPAAEQIVGPERETALLSNNLVRRGLNADHPRPVNLDVRRNIPFTYVVQMA
jgi:hypothetical protein